jgi:hypothetical protein
LAPAFGDLDGDGNLDIVYTNYEGGVTLLRNDSDSGHRITVALRGTRSNRFGVGSTVRIETDSGVQVRTLVLARGPFQLGAHPAFRLGEDSRIRRLTVRGRAATQSFSDLAGRQAVHDHRAVRAVSPASPGPAAPASFPRSAGHESLASRPARQRSTRPSSSRCCRCARTGAARPRGRRCQRRRQGRRGPWGHAIDPARILVADGAFLFSLSDSSVLAAEGPLDDGPLLLFDANGDGKNDLLITRGGSSLPAGSAAYQPVLFLNDGHGAFRPAQADALPRLAVSVGAVAAADFDRSGRLGVFVGGRVVPGQYPLPPEARCGRIAAAGSRT